MSERSFKRIQLLEQCLESLLLAVDAWTQAYAGRAQTDPQKLDDLAQLLAGVAARVRKELGK